MSDLYNDTPVTATPPADTGNATQVGGQTPADSSITASVPNSGSAPAVATTPSAAPSSAPAAAPAPVAAPAPAKPELNDEVLGKLAETMMSRMAQSVKPTAPSAPQAPQYTAEQIEALKPVRVTAEMLRGLGFEEATPEQVKGFQLFANAIVEHAAHIAAFVNQQQIQEARGEFQPIVTHFQQQQLEAAKSSFYNEHKDLQKYERFVGFAASKVQATKPDGSQKTAKEVSKEVADLTRSMLAEAGVDFKSSQNSANQGAAPSNTGIPKMSALDGPGRSMSGSSVTGKPNNPQSAIYED